MARVFHVSGCFSYDFEYFKLLILIFFIKFAVAYSFSWCGDNARKRPKHNDITDSFAVGIWALVNPLREGYIALTGVEGRGLPLPPPGDSDAQSVY